MQKGSIQREKARTAILRGIQIPCQNSGEVKKAKAQVLKELNLARNVEDNKKGFCGHIAE